MGFFFLLLFLISVRHFELLFCMKSTIQIKIDMIWFDLTVLFMFLCSSPDKAGRLKMFAPHSIKKTVWINANICTMCLFISGAFDMREAAAAQDGLQRRKHFLPSQRDKLQAQTHTNIQYVIWRCGAAAGRNQEEKKRKQRERGRQRGLLYTLTHVGYPALTTLPKHMTPL